MAAPVPLRANFAAAGLRAPARKTRDADQGRRLLALTEISDGGSRGTAAGLVLPRCDPQALHLEKLSQAVAPGAHAVVLLDRAGWRTSTRLPVPDNLTLLPLPAKSPELNPAENVWQFMRDDRLSNRVFASYRDILDLCCFAWNRLVEQP